MIQEANLHWRYLDTESNLIMPWYTLPALKWLKDQDTKNWNVFEYGAGYSTRWWVVNCRGGVSVDTSELWAKAMLANHITDKKEYIESCMYLQIDMGWDCIIIDGDWREDCIKFIQLLLNPGGYLIIDNYGGEDFPQDAVERTEELLKQWSKVIYKQPNHSTWATAIFQKPHE